MDINELAVALEDNSNEFKFGFLEAKIHNLEARFMQLFSTYMSVIEHQKVIYDVQAKLDEVYTRIVCLSVKESQVQLEVDRMNLIRRDIEDMQEDVHECIRKECDKIVHALRSNNAII